MNGKIVKVGNEKMEALYRIIWNKKNGAFYIKHGCNIVCRGIKGGDFCNIGKHNENINVLEFVQYYPDDGVLCLRSIIRFEFNSTTHRYKVKIKEKVVSTGKAEGIAMDGKNDTFPHLRYYALVKKVA